MQSNKLRMAIRATAATAVLSMAGQAQAFNFSAGDVDASVYGYARLSMSYDIDENIADSTQSGNPNSITGSDVDGHFGASANQSRLGIKATNSDGVMVNIEGDFLAGNFRIRHAYGSYKGVLAGQTWSNYNSFVGSTPTLDFNGVVGNAGYQSRTAQLRYTTGAMSFSVEDPKTSLTNKRDSTPTFTARLEDSSGGLSYSAAALVKQNTYDTGTADDSSMAFGIFGAAGIALSDMISIQGAVNYVDGATSYLYLSGSPGDGYLDGTSLENTSGMGGTLGASFKMGGGSSVNVAYGLTKPDDDGLAAGDTQTNQNLFVNYMWTPVKNTMMGVEYGYHDNEQQNGNSEDANRLMFAAQYNF